MGSILLPTTRFSRVNRINTQTPTLKTTMAMLWPLGSGSWKLRNSAPVAQPTHIKVAITR